MRLVFDEEALDDLQGIGQIGRDPGIHELIEEPYIIVYEVRERQGEVRVISHVHGARESE